LDKARIVVKLYIIILILKTQYSGACETTKLEIGSN
jgi:hypothetical protein